MTGMRRSSGITAEVLDVSNRFSWGRLAKILVQLFFFSYSIALTSHCKASVPQAKPPVTADSEYQKGLALLKDGDIEGARRAFERTVQLAPKSAEAHNSLGWILFSQGENDKAIQELRTAVRLKPSLLEARINLANALLRAHDPDAAQSEASEAIRLD